MRYIFKFPDIGEGLDEGTINQWYVKKGQAVKVGDPLVNMETDKVAADIPSPRNGVIAQIFGKVGDVVKVGEALVEIELEADENEVSANEDVKVEAVEEEGAGVVGTLEVAGNSAYLPASDEVHTSVSDEKKPVGRKALATPVARAYAKDLNIEINSVKGTGPAGRVTKQDILNHSNKAGSSVPKQVVSQSVVDSSELISYEPLSQIRKTIARNMSESKHKAAHMTVFEEVEISKLIDLRNRFKDQFAKKDVKLTYMAFILKAIALSLKKYKSLNAQLDLENNRMIYKNYFNIGIAVDTDYGLVVPVIKNVDKLTIMEIAQKITELAEKARKRELKLEDMQDGTFTITNYGAIGGLFAVPVINYPQAAILGTGRIYEKPIVVKGEIKVGTILPLSMSVDHRIVDGGDAARFLNQIMQYIEEPASMIME